MIGDSPSNVPITLPAMSYHVEAIPNRGRQPTILLRKAWREGKRIRRKILANLTHLPPGLIEGIRRVVKGGVAFERPDEAFAVRRSLAHGHVCAVLGTCRQLGLHRLRSRERDLVLAAIVARVLAPDSKLAAARQLTPETAASTLGAVLGLGEVTGNEMLAMLDWLLARQPWIEQSLANRHLRDGHPGALRHDVQPRRGAVLPAGGLRPQPRWQEGPAADRLRAALLARRLPGGGRRVRR